MVYVRFQQTRQVTRRRVTQYHEKHVYVQIMYNKERICYYMYYSSFPLDQHCINEL